MSLGRADVQPKWESAQDQDRPGRVTLEGQGPDGWELSIVNAAGDHVIAYRLDVYELAELAEFAVQEVCRTTLDSLLARLDLTMSQNGDSKQLEQGKDQNEKNGTGDQSGGKQE